MPVLYITSFVSDGCLWQVGPENIGVYAKLAANYNHVVVSHSHVAVSHSQDEYVKDGYHTNGLEGFWSHFKRSIIGCYHQVTPKHLQAYANETAFRFNTRKITDRQRFEHSIKNSEGRLTYNDLVKG